MQYATICPFLLQQLAATLLNCNADKITYWASSLYVSSTILFRTSHWQQLMEASNLSHHTGM